jgi:putative spermidine/putrescine transport system ATP-binding protein
MDGVQLVSSNLQHRKKGDKVKFSVRPERFSFAVEHKKDNILECTIENITFLGAVVRIQVKIGDTKFNMDTFNNPFLELPKIGDKDQVTCSKEAVLVLDD